MPIRDRIERNTHAEKLSQREWDWMKMLKPMDPPPAMVTTSILKRRGDTAALTLLQDTGV
ncbi:hypothetical protein P1O97_004530 [Escherichia coli]|nr:hypothetical protein [Escherichia coli]